MPDLPPQLPVISALAAEIAGQLDPDAVVVSMAITAATSGADIITYVVSPGTGPVRRYGWADGAAAISGAQDAISVLGAVDLTPPDTTEGVPGV